MKIQILYEHLQKSLPFITHAVSNRTQLPILSNLLLETKEGKLYISATDLEIGIETTIPASIEEEGGVTIPAKLFVELINTLPAEKISLETIPSGLLVTSKHAKSTLQTMNKDEFPVLYEEKGLEILRIKKTELKKHFQRVVFAASTDTTRPSLSGVLMKQKDSTFIFVATDGYRLSLQQNVSGQTSEPKETTLLIPGRVIREVLNFKNDGEVAVNTSKKNNQVIFSQEDAVIIGRLIEADFPNYEKILPASYSTKIAFDKDELHKAVKACAIFARETANIIRFALKENMIIVSANAPSVGENTVEVEAKLDGEEKEIAFNARYLLDLFANIEDEQMTFEMTGPLNPGVFRIANDSSFLHLIMPIRT